jgi:hypothetical protein
VEWQEFRELRNSVRNENKERCSRGLEFAGAAEGAEGEEEEEKGKGDGGGDKPVGDVAMEGAKGGAEPNDAEEGEAGADGFEKHLMKGAPEAVEAAARGGG